ncbi:MAG: hypothetical protein ACI9U2_003703 [Bradymonadia bacterium]|jgi:hypothetical protein
MRSIVILGILGLFMLPSMSAASDTKTAAKAQIVLNFDMLEGVQLEDRIEVRFVMSQASWTAVQRANIRPIIIAEVLSLARQSLIGKAGIVERTGRFDIVLPEGQTPRAVRFAMQHPRIKGFAQAGVSVLTLTRPISAAASTGAVKVEPKSTPIRQLAKPSQPLPTPVPVSNAAALGACVRYGKEADTCQTLIKTGKQTRATVVVDCGGYGKHDRIQCLREVSRTTTDMSGAVRGCAGRFTDASVRLNCVRRAAVARVDPSAGVRACSAQFADDAMALDCVTRIAYASANAQGLVDTCSNAFGAPDAQLDCIGIGARSAIDLSPAVLACTQALPWHKSRRQCISAAAASTVNLSSAIDACRMNTRSPEGLLKCVRHAAQGRKPGIAHAINGCGRVAGDETAFNTCVAQATAN